MEGKEEWQVINKDSGAVKAKHSSEEDAKAQVRLLEGLEHGWRPTNGA